MVPWTCLCWVFFIQWQRATFATPVPTRGSYQKACTAHPVPAAASCWFRFHSSAIQIQLEVDPEGTTLHSMPRLRKVSPGVRQAPGWCHSRAPRRVGLSGDRRCGLLLFRTVVVDAGPRVLAIVPRARRPEGYASGRLVMDSGLDAFSQYPSHGSFATPATRLIAETRGATRGFLSYYHMLPSSHPCNREGPLSSLICRESQPGSADE